MLIILNQCVTHQPTCLPARWVGIVFHYLHVTYGVHGHQLLLVGCSGSCVLHSHRPKDDWHQQRRRPVCVHLGRGRVQGEQEPFHAAAGMTCQHPSAGAPLTVAPSTRCRVDEAPTRKPLVFY